MNPIQTMGGTMPRPHNERRNKKAKKFRQAELLMRKGEREHDKNKIESSNRLMKSLQRK